MVTHKAGELFAFSAGEYSDYRFNGLYRALKDMDLAELASEYYETQVKVREVLELAPYRPMFGNTAGRKNGTHWIVFLKPNS